MTARRRWRPGGPTPAPWSLAAHGEVLGLQHYGQLGNGTTTSSPTAVDVTGVTGATALAAAGVYHTCALVSGGAVKCWGYNVYGQLGNGTTTQSSTPVNVTR